MLQRLNLPIDPHLDEIMQAVYDYSTVIVKASPGSGKTTRLPWHLAQKMNKRVTVLEPRRIAAKLAALRIAEEEDLKLGDEVGYHFRFEKVLSPQTKLIFYTEGTFLKKFLNDPELSETDIVILDEFHERHLDTDLALALLRELQTKRPELKIILMSATLDLSMMDSFSHAKSLEIEGKIYPVDISYLPNTPSILNQSLELKVKKAVERALIHGGDVLVFLPGMREMLKVQDVLRGDFKVFLLHADLSKEEQHRALSPSAKRKIILATNIAESSVTIPGIRIVIDSGIQREAHYSPWNGFKFIQDTPITKSSAIQRAGRAGRTGAGLCLRLYSEMDFNERQEFMVPEIERADLTDTYLLVQGIKLTPLWFKKPPEEKWKKAKTLCENLGAVTTTGELTPIGKKILDYPLDARLARILIEGEELKLDQKRLLLKYICEVIENDRTGNLYRRLNHYLSRSGDNSKSFEEMILVGFVDQVAKLRHKQKDFIHYSGKIIKLHHSLHDLQEDFYIILDITQRQEAIKVFPVEESSLWELDPFPFNEEEDIDVSNAISIKRKTKLGSIVLEEEPLKLNWNELSPALKGKINQASRTKWMTLLNSWKESEEYERLFYWGKIQNISLDEIESSLGPQDYFDVYPELQWNYVNQFFLSYFEAKLNVTDIERDLPTKIHLAGKREIKVHYPMGMDPYLEAPIQDFYGLNETPSLFKGKIPLTLKLLGPHKRPIQVTKDLKGFWQKTYQEMKKEYQRDYPRHYWPEKPWEAKPVLLKRMVEGN